MALYQELTWYIGTKNTPELNVPVLVRLIVPTQYHEAHTPYRAVRIAAPGVYGDTLYVAWNKIGVPKLSDVTAENSFTINDVADWTYL